MYRSTLMVFQLGCLRTMRLPTICPSSPPTWIQEWCHPRGRTTSLTMGDRPQAWCLRAILCLSSNQHSSISASNLGKHTATINVEVASQMLYRVTFLTLITGEYFLFFNYIVYLSTAERRLLLGVIQLSAMAYMFYNNC